MPARRVQSRQLQVFIDRLETQFIPDFIEQAAQKLFDSARDQNTRALGYRPDEEILTDGILGKPPREVRTDGGGYTEIEFDLAESVIPWVVAAFERLAPRGRGAKPEAARFGQSLIVLENNSVVRPPYRQSDPMATLKFGAISPYARKIEKGLSQQRPNGVFEHLLVPVVERYFKRSHHVYFAYRNWGVIAGGGFYKPGGKGRSSAQRDPSSLSRSDRSALSRYPTLIMEPKG